MAWTCVGCGEVHDDLPTSYRTGPPVLWQQLSPADQKRSILDEEVCLVRREGGEDAFFIRGNVEIPIVDAQGGKFVWTVWCSLSSENFKTVSAVSSARAAAETAPPHPDTGRPTNASTTQSLTHRVWGTMSRTGPGVAHQRPSRVVERCLDDLRPGGSGAAA
jgi:hypothetical protein